jgi:RNA polymerase sigma-70 factor (ECF subfamily)
MFNRLPTCDGLKTPGPGGAASGTLAGMASEPTLIELLRRWRDGDADAAGALFDRFARRLTALARANLARQLAPRLDGDDVVQSAFRTFFRRAAGGDLHLDGDGHLWRLLVRITLLKARQKGRFHRAGVRSVDAEADGPEAWLAGAAGREPDPDDAAVLLDEIDAVLHGLPPLYAEILGLRLHGHDVTDVAARLNISRRTVQRALKLLQGRLLGRTPDLIDPGPA